MGRLFLIALRNLAQHRVRSLLLGGAIAGVTALLVFLLALSNGMHSSLMSSATTLMTGHLNVGGFFKVTEGQSAPVVTGYPQIVEQVKAALGDEVAWVAHRGRGWAALVSDTATMQVGIGGVDIQQEPGMRQALKVLEGSLDGLAEPNTLLLFSEQATRLGVKVGDTLTFSAPTLRGVNNTLDVRLVAVAQDVGLLSSWNVYISAPSLRTLYQLNDTSTGAVLIYLRSLDRLTDAQARLRDALTRAGHQVMEPDPRPFWEKFQTVNREAWTGQKLDVTNWEEEVSFMRFALLGINGLSLILTVVLLVIIAVGIMNTLWVAIRERTQEIGTLRAIGMQRSGVLAMFVGEALSLSVLGTLGGALLGLGLCAVLNASGIHVPLAMRLFLMTDTLTLVPAAGPTALSVLGITACTTAIAVLPSLRAARLRPVTAMHHVG